MILNSILKNFLRRPKVKFYTEFPEITDQYPIYPAKDYKRKWVKNCARAFAKYKDKTENTQSLITAAKCPGMRNVMESGYIVQSWFDFTIETTADDDTEFKIYYPNQFEKHIEDIGYKNPLINSFNTKFSPLKIPTGNNLNSIIKIWTPYHFEVPDTHELLVLPVMYDDNPPFTACPGSISGFEIDFNVHVFWHAREGKTFVPAGTPLCQLVPIKRDKTKIITETTSDEVKKRVAERKFKKYSSFQL